MTSVLIATADRDAGGIRRALHDQITLVQSLEGLSLTLMAPKQRLTELCRSKAPMAHIVLSDHARRLARYLPALASSMMTSQRFDIAFCHNGFLAASLSRLARHVVGICHNDKPQQFSACDHLICLSSDGIKNAQAAGWHPDHLSLIPHYYEPLQPAPVPVMPRAPVTIGAGGRMVAKKNLSLVIDIAQIVKRTHPDIVFQLAGAGPLSARLQAYNQSKGAPVRLLGWTDFSQFLAEIDLLVVPSFDEPFGYVYPEAMSQAVAVLSSDSFGGRQNCETIAPLLPADKAQLWAEEICRLADDLESLLALQKACLAHSRAHKYAKQSAADSLKKLLTHLG